jgi:hypothetical protein
LIIACGFAFAATGAMAQDTIPNDVEVNFTVCMEGTGTSGDVCVTGNNNELTNWGNGVVMTDMGGDVWEVAVTFPAGTPADVKYKYKNDGCANWEGGGDRSVLLPIDGTTVVTLSPDSFNRVAPIGCGFSVPLSEDKTICFQVCLDGVESTGGQCVIGNVAELGEWDPSSGVSMKWIGSDLYQRCITWSAGTLSPIGLEYKFQKDDCATWEQIGEDPFANRLFEINDEMPAMTRLTSSWSDGGGICTPVATETSSWSTLKASY